jgi:hypothetical protein
LSAWLLLGVLVGVVSVIGKPSMAFGATLAPHATATTASPGSIGIRLLDVPASQANDPRARLYIVDHVAAGAVVQRNIEVSNTASSRLAVSLYAAGATIESGSFIGDAGHTANDLSSWTTVSQAAPQIQAGGTATATVTIAVPTDATAGERYAIVWAEVRTSAGAGGVTEVNRVGVRIYLSVGSGAAPAASLTIGSLTAGRSAHGNPVVIATVHNTGGTALDMSGTLQLSDGPGGLSAGPFLAALGVTLAIGATEPVIVTLDEVVPTGPWLAHVTLSSGLIERSAQATITFPPSGTASPVKAAATHHRSNAANVATVVVIAWMIAASSIAVLRRRRRAGHWFG